MRTAGNVVRAAQLLGLRRDALRYRMRRYGIVPPTLEALPQAPAVPPTMEAEQPSPSLEHTEAAAAVAEGTPGPLLARGGPWTGI